MGISGFFALKNLELSATIIRLQFTEACLLWLLGLFVTFCAEYNMQET